MKASTSLALAAVLSLAMATPVQKRDEEVVVHTVIDNVIVTVDVTTTINGSPPTPHANHLAYHAHKAAAHVHEAAPVVAKPATPAVKPQEKVAVQAPATTTPPTGNTPEDIQNAIDAKQEEINNEQMAKNSAHEAEMERLQNGGGGGGGNGPPVVAQPTPSVAAPPPAQSSSSSPPPSSNQPSGSPSTSTPTTGGSCGSIGGACSGDVTTYNNAGSGACGWSNDTNSQDFVALAWEMFGTYTNDAPGPHKNAYCGRQIAIVVDGKSYPGTITDKCPGCAGQSIDLSQHYFSEIYPQEPPGNGRFHNVAWHFTSEAIYDGPN